MSNKGREVHLEKFGVRASEVVWAVGRGQSHSNLTSVTVTFSSSGPHMGDIAKRKAWHQDPKLGLCTVLPELATVLEVVRLPSHVTPGLVSRLYHSEREILEGMSFTEDAYFALDMQIAIETNLGAHKRRWQTKA